MTLTSLIRTFQSPHPRNKLKEQNEVTTRSSKFYKLKASLDKWFDYLQDQCVLMKEKLAAMD